MELRFLIKLNGEKVLQYREEYYPRPLVSLLPIYSPWYEVPFVFEDCIIDEDIIYEDKRITP